MCKKVTAKILGGQSKDIEAATVSEAKSKLGEALGVDLSNYTASVNGVQKNDTAELSDHEFIAFSAPVKGGKK